MLGWQEGGCNRGCRHRGTDTVRTLLNERRHMCCVGLCGRDMDSIRFE